MKKFILIFSLFLQVMSFSSTQYVECSNEATTLRGIISVYVDQWYNATFDSVDKLVFNSTGTWNGSDNIGELLGTFSIQSNGEIRINLSVDRDETTPTVYNMIEQFQLLYKNDNSIIRSGNDHVVEFSIPAELSSNINIYDVRAVFNVGNDVKATGNNSMKLVYIVNFQPTTRLH